MTQTTVWTIGKLLEWTSGYLKEKGSQSGRLDAEVLLAHARQCERIQLYANLNEEPDETTKVAFREMVRRRAEGTPVAYLVGFREFYSLAFRVTPDVLIPRPETEHLVMAAIDYLKPLRERAGNPASPDARTLFVADICTGSGCVGGALLKQLPWLQVVASDVSAAAVAVAQNNFERLGVVDRACVLESDLFASFREDQEFDLIVCNPPYISESEFAELARDVREFEPKLALTASDNGMGLIKRLVSESPKHLRPQGAFFFEISPMLATACRELIASDPRWQLLGIDKDLSGHFRIVKIQLT